MTCSRSDCRRCGTQTCLECDAATCRLELRRGLCARCAPPVKAPRTREEITRQPAMLGAAIQEWRLRLGVTQGQLAARIGCDRTSVQRWEAGQDMPSAEHQLRLSRLIGCLECVTGTCRREGPGHAQRAPRTQEAAIEIMRIPYSDAEWAEIRRKRGRR